MRRSRLVVLPWLLLTGISDLGCTGTETGNPPRASVSLRLESSDAQRFSVGTGGAGVQIKEAKIGIQQLSFVKCDDQATTQVAKAVTVDLRGSESVFEVPEQPLCAVELRLEPRDLGWANVHAGANSKLSLGIAGLTTLTAPLFIEDDAPLPVVFRPSSFEVTPGTELVLSLDVATALSFDEVEQLPRDNDGEVVVASQQNTPILANIRQRWASSWSLHAVNGSGVSKLVATGQAQ
jgi:hypothetical protein